MNWCWYYSKIQHSEKYMIITVNPWSILLAFIVSHLFSDTKLRLVLVVNLHILYVFLCFINHFDECWEDIGNISWNRFFNYLFVNPVLLAQLHWLYKCNGSLRIMLFFLMFFYWFAQAQKDKEKYNCWGLKWPQTNQR